MYYKNTMNVCTYNTLLYLLLLCVLEQISVWLSIASSSDVFLIPIRDDPQKHEPIYIGTKVNLLLKLHPSTTTTTHVVHYYKALYWICSEYNIVNILYTTTLQQYNTEIQNIMQMYSSSKFLQMSIYYNPTRRLYKDPYF